MSRAALLLTQLDETYARLRSGLSGLTDEEFAWEPGPGCWTIHPDPGAPSGWTYDYAIPAPEPAPLTTVGWQLVHVATVKVMYHEWGFGPAKLTFPELSIPHTAAEAVALLEEGHALVRGDLAGLADGDLDEPRLTNWGERWPAWRLFWVLIDHDALHAGSIGCLRDLYLWQRRGAGGSV